MTNYLSIPVKCDIPSVIIEKYPGFVTFMEDFFKHLCTDNKHFDDLVNLLTDLKINEARNTSLDRFFNDAGIDLPLNTDQDRRLFLSILPHFLASRGSEDSIKYLFRMVYGEEITLVNNSRRVHIPSDGNFIIVQELSITVDEFLIFTGDRDDLIAITGQTSGSTAVINDPVLQNTAGGFSTWKFKISSRDGDFTPNEPLNLDYNGNIFVTNVNNSGIITGVQYTNKGEGYKLADTLTSSGNASYTVTRIGTNGFTRTVITSAGINYAVGDLITPQSTEGSGFQAVVSEVGGGGEIIEVEIVNPGHNYDTIQNGQISTQSGTGAVILLRGLGVGSIEQVEVSDVGHGFVANDPISVNTSTGINAVLEGTLGTVITKGGIFKDEHGSTSAIDHIYDGREFQNFSFTINTTIPRETWYPIVSSLFRPAGVYIG